MTPANGDQQAVLVDPRVAPIAPGRPMLVRIEREPHRAWPRCDGRELLDDKGRIVPAEKYPWCDRQGRWQWGEQHLCDLHAEALAERRWVGGISPNGEWGSCLVHIDCRHPIDDLDWETVYRKGETKAAAAMQSARPSDIGPNTSTYGGSDA